jgi:U3 small nucleolar RNA-associated protein 12
MVKAYLRYTQERVLGALVGNKSNIKLVKVKGTEGKFMATGCNEVVNLTNLRTGEVEYQIYDREAVHGEVTCLAASTTLLAVGYSDGAVLIFDLGELNQSPTQMLVSPFEQVHCFEFHRSAVTALIFSDENTQLVSGSTDTYIVLYDLVTSTAEYKLMGHTEPIT